MAKPKLDMRNVQKTGNTYRFRLAIPTDLQAFYHEQREIVIALDTGDEKEASAKAKPYRERYKLEFKDKRLNHSDTRNMTFEELDERADALVREAQRQYEKEHGQDKVGTPFHKGWLKKFAAGSEVRIFYYETTTNPKDSNELVRQRAIKKINGDLPMADSALTLNKILGIYIPILKEKGRSINRWNRFEKDIRKLVGDFIDSSGGEDKHIEAFKRDDVRAFKQKCKEDKNKNDTINKKIQTLSKIFDFGLDEIDSEKKNIFLRMKEDGDESDVRPFSVEQSRFMMKKILELPENGDSDRAIQTRETRSIAIITAMTGARISEICGLNADELNLKDDIPHFWIAPNGNRGNRLKTKAAKRPLFAVGRIKEELEKLPKEGPLYPRYMSLKDPFKCLSNNLRDLRIKWLEEYYKENLDIKPEGKLVWHSFRHTIKDAMRNSGVDSEIQSELLGHSKRGMAATYGDGHKLKLRMEAIDKTLKDLFG